MDADCDDPDELTMKTACSYTAWANNRSLNKLNVSSGFVHGSIE